MYNWQVTVEYATAGHPGVCKDAIPVTSASGHDARAQVDSTLDTIQAVTWYNILGVTKHD